MRRRLKAAKIAITNTITITRIRIGQLPTPNANSAVMAVGVKVGAMDIFGDIVGVVDDVVVGVDAGFVVGVRSA